MGIMDKISKKIENAAKDHGVVDSTTQEEKHNSEKSFESIMIPINKSDQKDINSFLKSKKIISDNDLLIGGYSNHKSNYNAVLSNVLSGKKNMKFLFIKDGKIYIARIDNNNFIVHSEYNKSDVVKVEKGSNLLAKTFKIVFRDGAKYSVDVVLNKDSVNPVVKSLK